jgi:murein DD-endopeptidase MepM/ murein hydrolase activator NlpD
MTYLTARHKSITAIAVACIALYMAACTTPHGGLFAKKTAHEQYAGRIKDAGLAGSTLGSLWFAAAQKALTRPLTVSLPYKETGYFAAEKPDAAGYLFTARRGEQLNIEITTRSLTGLTLFADLWQPATGNAQPTLLTAADTNMLHLQYEVEKDGRFILRLQPELLQQGGYAVTITTRPSLAFPVPGNRPPHIGSFWGDSRDAGGRHHEGIDIFGKFRTPVVAAASGFISSTQPNNLGGKVIFLQPEGKAYSLYYAHLDTVLVTTGQHVSTGDTLGLMGNTGNARNTPTHLHFGIYTGHGAIDPLPFVKTGEAAPAAVTADTGLLRQTVHSTGRTALHVSLEKGSTPAQLPANQVMRVNAAAAGWYKVVLPDSLEGFVDSKAVSARPYKKEVTSTIIRLLDAPDTLAAVKATVPAGAGISLLGQQGSFRFIGYGEQTGWVQL